MLITIMITDRIGLYKVLLQLIKTMTFNVPQKKKTVTVLSTYTGMTC